MAETTTAAPSVPTPSALVRLADWRDYVMYIVLLTVFAVFALALHDDGFLNSNNLLNVVRQSAIISIMAVAMTYVISAAEIDLSVGAIAGLSSVTTAMTMDPLGVVPAILIGIGTGALVGSINGVLVSVMAIPSFLVTLGMMGIVQGVGMWITDQAPQPIQSGVFTDVFGSGDVGPVPSLFVWMFVVALLGAVALRKTAYGRQVLATGGNEMAARYSGVNTRRIKFLVLLGTGVAAGLAGMLYAGRLHSGRFQWGMGDELSVIAAVIIGGTSLFGGRGSVIGAVAGALLIAMINNGLILMGLDTSQQLIIRGVIIVLAVALARRK